MPSPPGLPPTTGPDAPVLPTGFVIRGIAGSPGVVAGPAIVLGNARASYTRRYVARTLIEAEISRFHSAIQVARLSLREVNSRMAASLSPDQTTILDAYLLMMADPMLHERIETKIRTQRMAAEWAVAAAAEEIVTLFGGEQGGERSAYILERRHDVEFVADRILRALMGESPMIVPRLDQPTVIVARDLSPADTAGMVKEPVIAIVTESGTRTSHTAIMARALEVPAVVGAADALHTIRTGDFLIVDGLRGEIIVNPGPEALEDALARSARHLAFARGLLSGRNRPCVTACNTPVSLRANVEIPAEAILAVDHGAQGIGLYRTEFLFIDRSTQPDEEEQYSVYRAVVEAVSPFPVTLRTFDIGGDKFASSFQLPPEMNPALGLRAVRLALSRPDVFSIQLRAMVRASAHGDVRIMIPMVASVEEVRAVRRLLEDAKREVAARGQTYSANIPLGIMIEVPAAAVMADIFAGTADFFSLGTNDLIQYLLAVDRTHRSLAPLASPFHPAILRMIRNVVVAGATHKLGVSICGAMASDPIAATMLIGLGLREMSMEAAAIPEIKETLRRITVAECEDVAERALLCDSADGVEELVAGTFAPRLYDLLAGEETVHPRATDDSPLTS